MTCWISPVRASADRCRSGRLQAIWLRFAKACWKRSRPRIPAGFSIWQQLAILGVLLLTSKGAAAVTGGGFITLAATLSTIGTVPVAGLALLLGIDRFMSEARAITNLIGNGVATMVVAKWEGALDEQRARAVLAGETDALAEEPEAVADAEAEFALRVPVSADAEQ